MVKPNSQRPSSGRTNLASCVVATIFLIFSIIAILTVYFTVFKPKDPKISVHAVQIPSFAVTNNTANFTLSQFLAVRNPNRATFSHYDSTIQLLYLGNQVGFMFIPAGKIDPGQTQLMAATFTVKSLPLSVSPATAVSVNGYPGSPQTGPNLGDGFGFPGLGYANRVGPTLEIESKMELAGRVRVLIFFTHQVVTKSNCRITVSLTDGSVLGFNC